MFMNVYCWASVKSINVIIIILINSELHWIATAPPHLAVDENYPILLKYSSCISKYTSESLKAELIWKNIATKGIFQFEFIINTFASSFWFIWIPVLWVYAQ